MTNLMLHCGANAVSREELLACPTPSPTRTWQPIPHAMLADEVVFTLSQSGLTATQSARRRRPAWGCRRQDRHQISPSANAT